MGPAAFVLAKAVGEAPWLLAQTLLYSVPAYFLVGLAPTAGQFGYFLASMLLTNAALWCLAFALVTATPVVFLATLLLSVLTSFFTLLAGYLLPRPAMPAFWRALHW